MASDPQDTRSSAVAIIAIFAALTTAAITPAVILAVWKWALGF